MKSKIVNGYTKFYNDNGKYLMSYSTMTKPFTQDKFDNIPSYILDKATSWGKDMSKLILEAFSGGSIDKYTPEHQKCLKSLVNAIKTLNLTPMTIEKHIYNDIGHGYLDIDCDNAFIEVKTRSKLELELNTVIQCEIYRKICGKDYYIIYLNKKTGACKIYPSNEIPKEMTGLAFSIINSLEFLWETLE